MVIELSEYFRQTAIRCSSRLERDVKIFLNVHPREVSSPNFLNALGVFQRDAPINHPIVIEIGEASITNVSTMAKIKSAVARLGFEVAYDDFGIGQARFLELTDVPPDYLKLDIALIHGIETNKARQEIVSALLRVVGPLGTRVIAEGIETPEAAEMCRELGCPFGQGYYLGRPA
jgi:EAL domain-containing protein (putative c-di-GMP-specific phosphodiesterase class I)